MNLLKTIQSYIQKKKKNNSNVLYILFNREEKHCQTTITYVHDDGNKTPTVSITSLPALNSCQAATQKRQLVQLILKQHCACPKRDCTL